MEASKRSPSPRWDARLGFWAMAEKRPATSLVSPTGCFSGSLGTDTAVRFTVPLVFRNARDRSATVAPFHFITMRGSAVTTAT